MRLRVLLAAGLLVVASPVLEAGDDGEPARPLSITLGAARMWAREAGFAYAFSYLADLSDSLSGRLKSCSWGYWKWAPEIEAADGGPGGLSHITARASAVACIVRKVERTLPSGNVFRVPDTLAVIHDFLLSGGIEATSALDGLAGIVEAGYVPWLPPGWDWIDFGAFVQAGRQFRIAEEDTTGTAAQLEDGWVARAHARLQAEARFPAEARRAIGIQARGRFWYDIQEQAPHYSAKAALRLYFERYRSIDITYERNSGAPAFVEGDQFGIGLTFALTD